MKFYKSEFEISKEYEEKLQEKLRIFTEETKDFQIASPHIDYFFRIEAEQT